MVDDNKTIIDRIVSGCTQAEDPLECLRIRILIPTIEALIKDGCIAEADTLSAMYAMYRQTVPEEYHR